MAIKRLTVSIPEELMEQIKKAAGGEPVSTWVTELIRRRIEEQNGDAFWQEMIATSKTTRSPQVESELAEFLDQVDERQRELDKGTYDQADAA